MNDNRISIGVIESVYDSDTSVTILQMNVNTVSIDIIESIYDIEASVSS